MSRLHACTEADIHTHKFSHNTKYTFHAYAYGVGAGVGDGVGARVGCGEGIVVGAGVGEVGDGVCDAVEGCVEVGAGVGDGVCARVGCGNGVGDGGLHVVEALPVAEGHEMHVVIPAFGA